MIGCAVFDLDGALVDSVPHFTIILNAMLADRGAATRLTDPEVRPHATAGGRPMIAGLLGETCGPIDVALGEFRERYGAMPTPADSLYPNVRETLAALKSADIALAVWSNKPQGLCDKVIDDLDLRRLFDAVVGSGPGVPHKPDPTGYDLALAGAGGTRARSCFVGDSEPDYRAAQLAGAPFIMLTYGYGDYTRDWPGAALVSDFADVAPIILRRFAP